MNNAIKYVKKRSNSNLPYYDLESESANDEITIDQVLQSSTNTSNNLDLNTAIDTTLTSDNNNNSSTTAADFEMSQSEFLY